MPYPDREELDGKSLAERLELEEAPDRFIQQKEDTTWHGAEDFTPVSKPPSGPVVKYGEGIPAEEQGQPMTEEELKNLEE
jgi:hypothetical protein